MDGLDNRQIVLLTLLVSFVTSIATGIVTVTLVEEAPQGFTSTINKVVETTVEKVVPKETVVQVVKEVKGESPATLIATVVAEREPAMVSIILRSNFSKDQSGVETEEIVETQTGFFVSQNGFIATVSGKLVKDRVYRIKTTDGEILKASLINSNKGVAVLKLEPEDEKDPISKIVSGEDSVPYIPIAKNLPPLGSHVVSLARSLSKGTTVLDGIISAYEKGDDELVDSIETTISGASGGEGGPLMTLTGELIGVTRYNSNGSIMYSPMSDIADIMRNYVTEGDVLGESTENSGSDENSEIPATEDQVI